MKRILTLTAILIVFRLLPISGGLYAAEALPPVKPNQAEAE